MCSNEEILLLLLSADTPQEKATLLAHRANANGGIDNITCIYIAFH
jgi:serine/threonine protein phosphatase PrpC